MRYVTCDVFTDTPFAGNPLAVVLQADGLTTAEMQAIAAEFGYSETAFVQAPTRPGFDARVRIFTPTMELAFAGHPNIGTALVLAEGDRTLRFQEGVGPVAVEVRDSTAEVRAPQAFRRIGAASRDAVASACGLPTAAIVGEPVVASCGTPFIVAETSSLDDAAPMAPLTSHGALGILLHTPGDAVRARMFALAAGVPEDPATGSAALVLAGLLAEQHGAGSWVIEQGAGLGRPSRLHIRADGTGTTWVAGRAVVVMRGSLVTT